LRAHGFDVVRFPVAGSLWEVLHRVFDRGDVTCVLDVGAHVGEYGTFLRHHGYQGHIISFEPGAEARRGLAARAERDERWDVHPFALGAVDEVRTLRVATADNLSSFLVATPTAHERFRGAIAVREEVEVDVKRLDSVFTDVTSQVEPGGRFLKCDTQGVDLEVVGGAGAILSQLAGLQLELDVEPLYEGSAGLLDGLETLAGQGFRVAGMFPVARDESARLLQVEAVFVAP
jgi:FkbM family methyltransferase